MTRPSNREPNEPSETNEPAESAWKALRTAISPRPDGPAVGDTPMDERPGVLEGGADRPRLDEAGGSDGAPVEDADHRSTPTARRFVVSVDDDGTAESRLLSDGGTAADSRGRYTVDVTAKTDSGVASHSVASNDVSETFEGLVRWYASQVAPDEDPAEVVDVLLAASDLD